MTVKQIVIIVFCVISLVGCIVALIFAIKSQREYSRAIREYDEATRRIEKRKVCLTVKGIAVFCAIENNLLPKVEGGWDDTNFEKFWEAFEQNLDEAGYIIEVKKQ